MLFAASLQAPVLAADPAVTWVTTEWTADTHDVGDHYQSFLMERLPGFDHRLMRGSIGRLWHEVEHGRAGTCIVNALETPERERFAVFGRRPLLTPGYRLYFARGRRETLSPYLDGAGQVDLSRLIAAPLRGGITAGRPYNPVIGAFLDARRKGRPLDSRVSNRQLFNLLRTGRLDFTFATPLDDFEVKDALDSLPIAGSEGWNATFVACSRDTTGVAVIAAVDGVFGNDENWAEFIEPLRDILSPEDYAIALRSTLP